ncbi:MAG: ATP-binding cassette domain-containing protein [Litorilituus sp.]|jgi:cationic peptide transport system ATP-binding protein|nr:ATP-binding cassette domain-containing protein [Litorilituus sp.]
MADLLRVEALTKSYHRKVFGFNKKQTTVLDSISFSVKAHKTLAVIGKTGSGKSSLAKILVGAEPATSGKIYLNGNALKTGSYRHRCQHIRMIFQDSGTTLNPSLTIQQLLDEPLKLNTPFEEKKRTELIRQTLQKVGLLGDHMNFYPHMFSGGQKQRISLARAIILQPQVIILDEALASLDPSLRSQIINLLLDLQQQMGLAYILISHNMGIIRHFSDDIMVLSQGKIVEEGKTLDVMAKPKHKVTQRLMMNQNFQLRNKRS